MVPCPKKCFCPLGQPDQPEVTTSRGHAPPPGVLADKVVTLARAWRESGASLRLASGLQDGEHGDTGTWVGSSLGSARAAAAYVRGPHSPWGLPGIAVCACGTHHPQDSKGHCPTPSVQLQGHLSLLGKHGLRGNLWLSHKAPGGTGISARQGVGPALCPCLGGAGQDVTSSQRGPWWEPDPILTQAPELGKALPSSGQPVPVPLWEVASLHESRPWSGNPARSSGTSRPECAVTWASVWPELGEGMVPTAPPSPLSLAGIHGGHHLV